MRPVDGTKLARGSFKMLFGSALRDVQDLADFPGRLALRSPGEHLALARGQAHRSSGRRFEQAGSPIAALFVSAVAAPGHVGYEHIPESDRGLLDAVSEMTGVNPEFLENEEFAASILPPLIMMTMWRRERPVGPVVEPLVARSGV